VKKLLIGCAVVVGLCMVGGAVGSYFLYHKVKSAVGGFTQLAKVPEIERSVRNQSPYQPPASGELTKEQVERYYRVQQAIRASLGARGTQMQEKYKSLLAKKEATAIDAPQLFAAYSDLASGYVDAKRVQVQALNDAGISMGEYRWIRTQTYAALGFPMMDMDFAKMVEDAKAGRKTAPPPLPALTVGPAGPKVNQDLVKSHQKDFEDYAALAFFGL
jgi:hypothetical protein